MTLAHARPDIVSLVLIQNRCQQLTPSATDPISLPIEYYNSLKFVEV